jgi:hypothetical protein
LASLSCLKKIHINFGSAWSGPLKLAHSISLVAVAFGSLFYASTLAPQDYTVGLESKQIMSERAYAGARTFSLYRSFQNFSSKPIFGIGFGVPSDPRLINEDFSNQAVEALRNGEGADVLFDKGNSYVAIFEEVGMVGAIFWLGLFVYLIVVASSAGLAPLCVGIIFTVSILAEATAFSMGGVGMLMWSSLILATGLTTTRKHKKRRHRQLKSTNDNHRQNGSKRSIENLIEAGFDGAS